MRSILFGVFKYLTWALAAIICLFFLGEERSMTLKGGVMLICIVVLDILFNIDAFVMRYVRSNKKKLANGEKLKLSQAILDATEARRDAIVARKEAEKSKKLADKVSKENERLKKKKGKKTNEETEPAAQNASQEPINASFSAENVKALESGEEGVLATIKDSWSKLRTKGGKWLDKINRDGDA